MWYNLLTSFLLQSNLFVSYVCTYRLSFRWPELLQPSLKAFMKSFFSVCQCTNYIQAFTTIPNLVFFVLQSNSYARMHVQQSLKVFMIKKYFFQPKKNQGRSPSVACFVNGDRPTDRRTDGPTDRQSGLWSRVHATKKMFTSLLQNVILILA